MTTNKFYAIGFLLLFATACEKKINGNVTSKTQDTSRVLSVTTTDKLSRDAVDNNFEKSFVISCGSGCAMTYNVENITRNKNFIKVNFAVEMSIDGVQQKTQKESYFFYFDTANKLIKIKKYGENDSFLETQTQDAQDSFNEFGNSLVQGGTAKSMFENSIIYDKTTDPKTVKYEYIDVASIKNLKKFSCDEKNARFTSLPSKENIKLLLVPQDCGDFDYRYYLLTVKNNEVISSRYVEGIWQEPEDEDSKEITTFKIDNNFNIIITTKLSNSIKLAKYHIAEDGKIVDI